MKMASHKITFLFFTLSLLLCSATLPAGVGTWTSNGPYGAHVLSLAINPAQANEVFLLSQGGYPTRLFRSHDGGKSWTWISTPEEFSFVAMNPSVPSRITALGSDAYALQLYQSLDDGATWQHV